MLIPSINNQTAAAFLFGVVCGLGLREVYSALNLKIYRKRVMKGVDQMAELNQQWVHMKDPEKVKKLISNIIADGKQCLQVIADYDRTLTRFSYNGKILPTCHGVMDCSDLLPKEYREKTDALRKKYYAIEIDPSLTPAQKIPYMIEWWTKAHDMMAELQIRKDDIRKIVRESEMMLRAGCSDMFDRLQDLSIPLLIFSAGIGDIIYEGLIKCAQYHDNMKIVSNFMDFNGQGVMTGFHGDLIHTFNKNENAIHDSDYFQELQHRHNVILLGDSMGDLKMAEGADSKNCLKIGFLNDKIEDLLDEYMEAWDIVLVSDDTMDIMNAILRYL